MNKKRALTILLALGLLATPQKSEAFIGWATACVVSGITCCVGSYVTRHNNVSNFIRDQKRIICYITYVSVYPDRKFKQKISTVLEASSPEVMIEKFMEFAEQYKDGNYSLRARPAIVLDDGEIVQLKKIRIHASKIETIKKTITARIVIPDSFHLTYRGTLALGAIPVAVGAGPIGLLIPTLFLL